MAYIDFINGRSTGGCDENDDEHYAVEESIHVRASYQGHSIQTAINDDNIQSMHIDIWKISMSQINHECIN